MSTHSWQLWVGKDLPHLRGHAADGGDIVASVEEVGSVRLQLELTQPVVNGFCILGRGRDTEQSMTGGCRSWKNLTAPGKMTGSPWERPTCVLKTQFPVSLVQ